ncbi:uncharacterized protein LOC125650791 [Ostrea edulis]|uniref:uncharacterized protein LOC125650791 n=1 Tax=Ostrea edulis TaxID=37623 RepID=UPI0020964CA1|nr:uncharacterized protein LOC125650791 [Ostrea edulis]
MASNIQYQKGDRPDLAKHDSSVLDLVFAMDCTGSMSSYINTARDNIRNIVEGIVAAEKSDVRLALVEYRDHPPQESTFVTRVHDFTPSVGTMKKWLAACSASGGGDTPEAVADALHDVLKLTWRENATKICVLISDAPPHGLDPNGDTFPNGCPAGLDPMVTVRELAEKGITLYSVGCEPAINKYRDFFMALVYITGGQYVPLAGSKMLTQVIIGGAQEEISLEKWMAEVDEEIKREMDAGREINDEEMSHMVHKKLKSKGAVAQHLRQNNVGLDIASDDIKKYSEITNMADIRKRYKMAAPTPMARSSDVYGCEKGMLSMPQAMRMVQKSKARMKRK